MPLASVALMNLLIKNGFEVEGLNYGLERSLDNRFDFSEWLRNRDFKAVAIDLHYHGHSYNALKLAEICKEIKPDAAVILGGFTATYFCTEIMRNFQQVDVVIKGDAEEPLLSVVRNVCKHKMQNIGEIGNVCYRKGNVIKENSIRYTATQGDLDSLDFIDLRFLCHWRQYHKTLPWGYQPSMEDRYWTCVGRGCKYSCSYCGGSRMSQYILCRRTSPVFRSPIKLADDVSYLKDNGVDLVMLSHDLNLAGKKYWSEFFAEVRKRRIDIGIYMGLWQLFEREFIDELARTFDTSLSWLSFSPTSGNEFVRRFNGKHFSDRELFERLLWFKNLGLQLEIFFALNLPKETDLTFKESIALGKRILEIYPAGKLKLHCQPIILDPCCPMSLYPQKFGIKPLVFTFKDYYEKNKEYYERQRVTNQRSRGEELKYFSHTTETIKSPLDIMQRRDKWRKEVFGIEHEGSSSKSA
jgi:radical SAM superfamily enzyme YgiQ (UPF0313 family)